MYDKDWEGFSATLHTRELSSPILRCVLYVLPPTFLPLSCSLLVVFLYFVYLVLIFLPSVPRPFFCWRNFQIITTTTTTITTDAGLQTATTATATATTAEAAVVPATHTRHTPLLLLLPPLPPPLPTLRCRFPLSPPLHARPLRHLRDRPSDPPPTTRRGERSRVLLPDFPHGSFSFLPPLLPYFRHFIR